MPKTKTQLAAISTPVIDWGNMRSEEKTLNVAFYGAGSTGCAFRGWCGEVAEWPGKSAPKIRFGEWRADPKSNRGAGVATCKVRPFSIIMFGANSPAMRSKDKTTHFGFAGLHDDGTLRDALLPKNMDARALFAGGGWPTQNIDVFVAKVSQLNTMGSHKDLVALMDVIAEAFHDSGLLFRYSYEDAGKGDHMGALEDILKRLPVIQTSWPYLSPFCEIAVSKLQEWQDMRQQKRARFAQAKEMAMAA